MTRRILCILLFAIMLCAALGTGGSQAARDKQREEIRSNVDRLWQLEELLRERVEHLERRLEHLESLCTCLEVSLPEDVPLHAEDDVEPLHDLQEIFAPDNDGV